MYIMQSMKSLVARLRGFLKALRCTLVQSETYMYMEVFLKHIQGLFHEILLTVGLSSSDQSYKKNPLF